MGGTGKQCRGADWGEYLVRESLKNFYNYIASDEELFVYIRINAGRWNEKSYLQMKKIVKEVIKDYKNEDCYPKAFVRYFVTNIPSIINILSGFRHCPDEEISEYHTEEMYLSMIAERIKELKNLQREFINSLWNLYIL